MGWGNFVLDMRYYVAMKSNKTALVTGAAARIGASVVRNLHNRGCDIILHYHSSREAADALKESLNAERPESAITVSADLSTEDGINSLVSTVKSQCDGLDVLVNNASRFYPTRTGETTQSQWDDLLNSNLKGPFFLVQGLVDELRQAGGSVINLVDIHAERPMKNHTVYCISKAGLVMMTRALASELGPEIRVNGVAPGAIMWPEQEPTDAVKKTILDRTALGTIGDPSDIAGAVEYLALDAPYVTGQILAVDGGRTLNM